MWSIILFLFPTWERFRDIEHKRFKRQLIYSLLVIRFNTQRCKSVKFAAIILQIAHYKKIIIPKCLSTRDDYFIVRQVSAWSVWHILTFLDGLSADSIYNIVQYRSTLIQNKRKKAEPKQRIRSLELCSNKSIIGSRE